MVLDAVAEADIVKRGEVDREELLDVLKVVSSRLTANAARDDAAVPSLRRPRVLDLSDIKVEKCFSPKSTLLKRYYTVWQDHARMPSCQSCGRPTCT